MGIDPYFLDNRIPQVAAALGDKDQPTDDRYRWMVETVREVLFEADPQGNWTYLNPAWTRILGYQVGDCLGKPFLDFVHPEDRESNLKIFLDVVQGGKDRCRFEARYLTQSGTIRHMEIHAWIFRSEKGEPLGSTGTLTDVTERRLAEIALEHRATHDTLTGLPNRDSLGRQLLSALRIDHAFKPIALMFLDLDRFKLINDSLGHDAGDELLRVVAERVRHTVRAGDFIGRFGGDEFVIICSGLDTEQARAMAQSLRLALAKPMHIEGQELTLTVSIGIRILHPDEELPCPPEVFAKILLRDADSAMYAAKTSGRDRAEIFDLPMHGKCSAQGA
jgi:diguanylate cyclase (GGDEF)-like protein/PAS domain S-box-containing protein